MWDLCAVGDREAPAYARHGATHACSLHSSYLPETTTSTARASQFLTVSEAAQFLGVHANTVRSWTSRGLLSCLRINGRGDRRYARDVLERFVATAAGDLITDDPGALLDATAEIAAAAPDSRAALFEIARLLCTRGGYEAAAWLSHDAKLTRIHGRMRADRRLARDALRRAAVMSKPASRGDSVSLTALPVNLAAAEGGVLMLASGAPRPATVEQRLLTAIADQVEMSARMSARMSEALERGRRAELLMSVGGEIGSQLDRGLALGRLVERTAELFDAEHGAIFTRGPDGRYRAEATRNLSDAYRQSIEHASALPLVMTAISERRIVSVTDVADDRRMHDLRLALLREGINTLTIAPLHADGEPLGVLALYHDRRHEWAPDDLELLERLAAHGSMIMRNAHNYGRMATWAAQLQSIQQLGTRLTRLRSVVDIGHTICTELNQLIESHNIRVYRVAGPDCVPVAWRGEIGEYQDEDSEQLKLKVGEGITGWVARHGLAQSVGNAAADDRAMTIPGTDDDLDESLLLAPMLFDDEVIGVIVLAKIGINQFGPDDLRVLEIYASIAAQAMANADATERLRAQSEALARQLNSQRELLRVTESILTTLDTQTLLDEIAERLESLISVDNIAVRLHDVAARRLRTIFARGVHAKAFLKRDFNDDEGLSGVVLRSGEAELVQDELADPRVLHFSGPEPRPGALIACPLRSGEGVQGVLTLERLGSNSRFSDEEFELVKLFAAHVSIALRNAAAHREVELRAATDRLTGLLNHGALIENIDRLVAHGTRFSTLMVDLDGFKDYNDSLGHQAGNVLLQRVAAVLRDSCREADLIFRFGGDEFIVVLPNTGMSGARTVADKILPAVRRVDERPDLESRVSCSIGIANHPKDARDAVSIIIAADRACYAAKRAGRDRIATAAQGLALATEFRPTEPAPRDLPESAYSAA